MTRLLFGLGRRIQSMRLFARATTAFATIRSPLARERLGFSHLGPKPFQPQHGLGKCSSEFLQTRLGHGSS